MKYCYDYPRAAVTADIAVFRPCGNSYEILLIQRKNPPFKGMWALPGGFMEMNETLEECAARELQEETGISGLTLGQFRTYSQPQRDPRHRTVTTVYAANLANRDIRVMAGDDADALQWFHIKNLPAMAFDHSRIINDLINSFLH